jgi:LysM repeat protein
VLIQPTFFYCYRGFRLFRKRLRLSIESFGFKIDSKHVAHILIIVLSFLVTGANLQAYELPLISSGMGQHSIISEISGSEIEDLVVEEASSVELVKEVTYLDAHAVRPKAESLGQILAQQQIDPSLDILSEPVLSTSILVNAIRIQTDITTAEDSIKTRTEVVEHVVEAGENIGSIARRYGLETRTILSSNNLSARSIIRPGQKLKILPVDGITYTVKRGDTLLSIGNKYKSTTEKIIEFNALADAGALSIGQVLILPGGELPPPPPPSPTRVSINLRQVFSPATDIGGGRLLWPTSARRITQYFNRRHQGVDIAAPVGAPIYAADDGVVIFSGWNSGGYGRMIIVEHGNGLFTRYAHGSRNLVQSGDAVKRGDVIQLMGSTGRSTGSHLHFEVLSGGIYKRVNPFDYIQ